ncbi:MAG: TauD/TfdA dioxygenase family protein, partial [Stellaceae bacterium]
MALTAIPLTPHIAAEIRGIDLTVGADSETVAELQRLWLKHLVLVFRGSVLGRRICCASRAGSDASAGSRDPGPTVPRAYERLLENIMVISNIREEGEPIGALPDGEMMFHHDMLHARVPHKGTCLYSVDVPATGGNTLFANCTTAYDTLPAALREPLEGRKAFHHYNYGSVQK